MCLQPAKVRPYQVEVERGIEYLDEEFPTWWTRIKLSMLRLDDCMNCVLGQLTGRSYSESVHHRPRNWPDDRGFNRRDLDMHELGYEGYKTESKKEYRLLTKEWERRIKERRALELSKSFEMVGV